MPAAEAISPRAAELASVAHEVITAQKFDYFDSRLDAEQHAFFEHFITSDVEEAGDYYKLPRLYYHDLEQDLGAAIHNLSSGKREWQHFAHIDRATATVGALYGAGENEVSIELSPDSRSCSLRLENCLFTQYSRSEATGGLEAITSQNGTLDLVLGRNVLNTGYDDLGLEQAIYDLDRHWERVLIVGGSAVSNFINEGLERFRDEDPPMNRLFQSLAHWLIKSGNGRVKIG